MSDEVQEAFAIDPDQPIDQLFGKLCAYARIPGEEQASASSYRNASVDWETLYLQAKFHRVLPLVHLNRLQWGEQVPSWTHNDLRVAQTRNQFFLDELQNVLEVLDTHGVRVLPFKGPVLTYRLFPDLRHRFSGDLDLLIPSKALGTVIEALDTLGYAEIDDPSLVQRRIRTLIHSQHTLARGNSFFFLDVHTRIMPRLYAYRQPFDALWERADTVDVSGRTTKCLSAPDQILMLCYQGVKNRWDRLKYVVDVAAALHAYPDDGKALLNTARSLSSVRSLLLGCVLARDLLAAPLPSAVADRATHASTVQTLAARVKRALAQPQRHGIDAFWDRAAFQLRVQDGIGPRMRYIGYAFLRKLIDGPRGGD